MCKLMPPPMTILEVALKSAKNSSKSVILKHWNTKEDLICTGSYEKALVNYLNNHGIHYKWQHKTFIMPNGKTYRPDCYLINEDKWIEVKGYMREKGRIKWEWFHENYPNSELWDKDKLKYMGVL